MTDSEIWVNGTRRYCGPFQREWCDLLPSPPKVIIDCGAFDGGDSYRFRGWFPSARVISIEPHPVLAERLRRDGDLEVHELALFSTTGEADFYFGDMQDGQPGPSGSLYRITDERACALMAYRLYSRAPVRVRTSTLSDLCRDLSIEVVDILQIDGEGSEFDIVSGFGSLRPVIVMGETHIFQDMQDCNHTRSDFMTLMSSLGYRIIEEGDDDTVWIWRG